MRLESIDPLLPAWYDLGWSVLGAAVVVAHVVLLLAAIWSISSSRQLTGAGRLLWIVVVLAFPLLGSVGWFLGGRSARLDRGVL
jgi:hypothetical protein